MQGGICFDHQPFCRSWPLVLVFLSIVAMLFAVCVEFSMFGVLMRSITNVSCYFLFFFLLRCSFRYVESSTFLVSMQSITDAARHRIALTFVASFWSVFCLILLLFKTHTTNSLTGTASTKILVKSSVSRFHPS